MTPCCHSYCRNPLASILLLKTSQYSFFLQSDPTIFDPLAGILYFRFIYVNVFLVLELLHNVYLNARFFTMSKEFNLPLLWSILMSTGSYRYPLTEVLGDPMVLRVYELRKYIVHIITYAGCVKENIWSLVEI